MRKMVKESDGLRALETKSTPAPSWLAAALGRWFVPKSVRRSATSITDLRLLGELLTERKIAWAPEVGYSGLIEAITLISLKSSKPSDGRTAAPGTTAVRLAKTRRGGVYEATVTVDGESIAFSGDPDHRKAIRVPLSLMSGPSSLSGRGGEELRTSVTSSPMPAVLAAVEAFSGARTKVRFAKPTTLKDVDALSEPKVGLTRGIGEVTMGGLRVTLDGLHGEAPGPVKYYAVVDRVVSMAAEMPSLEG